MKKVEWEIGFVLPKQITGTPMWLDTKPLRDLDISRSVRLIGTPEKQSGEFLNWAKGQATDGTIFADIRHFQRLAEVLEGKSSQVEGRYTHFVLAGIVFDTTEQIRVVEKVTVAGKTTDQPKMIDVNMRSVPVMNLFVINNKPVWGVALYPANQYYGRLGGHDTALVLIG